MRTSSGQTIALGRFVLASVFLFAIYVDPSQPTAAPFAAYILLGCYVALALLVLALTWSDWWLDHVLARPLHVADLALFGAVVFATEGYTSPFFTFSVFLLLSSTIRWGWKETGYTALAVNLLFVSAGILSALTVPAEVDTQRLMIRGAYLLVLSALFVLYAHRNEARAETGLGSSRLHEAVELARLMELAVGVVGEETEASRVVVAWQDEDEPRSWVLAWNEQGVERRELSEGELNQLLAASPAHPFLFSTESRHLLVDGGASPKRGKAARPLTQFLQREEMTCGLAIPVKSTCLKCIIFAAEVPDLARDHLVGASRLAEEVSRMSEQVLFSRLWEETTGARIRLSIARDLHDSVAQLLAGISFRLEALKRSGESADELSREFGILQYELSAEQQQIRKLITELRQPAEAAIAVDIAARLPALAERLSRQWRLECTYSGEGRVRGAALLEHELHQMVREAVANAARHGAATKVSVELRSSGSMLEIRFTDNGSGLSPDGADPVRPRSLCERAEALGGKLDIGQDERGSTVRIVIPDRLAQ